MPPLRAAPASSASPARSAGAPSRGAGPAVCNAAPARSGPLPPGTRVYRPPARPEFGGRKHAQGGGGGGGSPRSLRRGARTDPEASATARTEPSSPVQLPPLAGGATPSADTRTQLTALEHAINPHQPFLSLYVLPHHVSPALARQLQKQQEEEELGAAPHSPRRASSPREAFVDIYHAPLPQPPPLPPSQRSPRAARPPATAAITGSARSGSAGSAGRPTKPGNQASPAAWQVPPTTLQLYNPDRLPPPSARGHRKPRKRGQRRQRAVIVMQRIVRGWIARRRVAALLLRTLAAERIQTLVRGVLARRRCAALRASGGGGNSGGGGGSSGGGGGDGGGGSSS